MSESSQSGTLGDVFTKQLWDAEVFTLTLFFSSSEGKEEAGGSAGNNPPSLYCLPSVGLVFRVYMCSSLREHWGFHRQETEPGKSSESFYVAWTGAQVRGFWGAASWDLRSMCWKIMCLGKRGEVSSPLGVYGDSFPKTSPAAVLLCSGGEGDRL